MSGGRFLHADLTRLELGEVSVEAVGALYVLGHIPREALALVFQSIGRWLRPGGYLVATTGRRDVPGVVDTDWLGAPMFFSSFDANTNLRLLGEAGLDVLEHEVICQDEGEQGEACFLWALAWKTA